MSFEGAERRYLAVLSFGLGISQGCGLCFYVASCAYFAALFNDRDFLINACAFFYLPPILVTLIQVFLDQRFDVLLGIRPVIRFRIYLSSLLVVLCLLALCCFVESPAYPGEGSFVYACGVLIGVFAAIFLSSSCLLFGAVDPRFVPYLILGQTFAGVYTNASAKLLGFVPGCSPWRVRAFFGLAACSVIAGTLVYSVYHWCRLLERTYQHHEVLLSVSQPCGDAGAGGWACGGLPVLCWSMLLCQAVAIAMNMSLTPLANQVAHGNFGLTQALLLVKLLADFVGRVLYLLLPKPRHGPSCSLRSVRGQAAAVWLLELLRLPVWLLLYRWALGSSTPSFLANEFVLLWLAWLPLIATGALSGSWCFVIAVTAAPESRRREVNLLMSLSVYAGFAGGILLALLSK